MIKQLLQFLTRWLVNCLGLWIAGAVGVLTISGGTIYLVVSALLLALLNAVMKPILIIISLPIIAISLGFFLIIINGIVVYALDMLYSPLKVQNFWYAMLAGIVIGLVNYIVTIVYERFFDK
mgnify:CR=1 FL=1